MDRRNSSIQKLASRLGTARPYPKLAPIEYSPGTLDDPETYLEPVSSSQPYSNLLVAYKRSCHAEETISVGSRSPFIIPIHLGNRFIASATA